MSEQLQDAALTRTVFQAVVPLDNSEKALAQTRLAVARAKTGNQEALRFLYVQYAGNVYGYVRSIVRDEHDAEDVTQHVFAKLLTAIGSYNERGIPFFAWLLRMARNAAIDHLRLRARQTPVETVLDPETSNSSALEDTMLVRDAIASLPRDQREVMVLRHIVGLSPGEIANSLGRTEASIHGLQHRGRRTLQTTLIGLGSRPSTLKPSRVPA